MGKKMSHASAPIPAPTHAPIGSPNTADATAEFGFSLAISVPFLVILLITYCFCRVWKPRFWETRRIYADIDDDEHAIEDNEDNTNDDNKNDDDDGEGDEKKEKPKPIPNRVNPVTYADYSLTYFAWMKEVWQISNTDFYRHAGFDALIYRLYLKGMIYVCLSALPYALFILLPVYYTSYHEGDSNDVINMMSINTVRDKSHRLWATVIGCYIFTLLSLYNLSKTYLIIAYATDKWMIGINDPELDLSELDNIGFFNYREMMSNLIDNVVETINNDNDNDDDEKDETDNDHTDEQSVFLPQNGSTMDVQIPQIDRYSVMIRNLPTPFDNDRIIYDFLNRLFNGQIAQVHIIYDVKELIEIESKIDRYTNALLALSEKHEFDIDDRENYPEIYEGKYCCGACGDQYNVVTYYCTKRDALVEQFYKLKNDGLKATPTAFVTFKSLESASNCNSCPIRFGLQTLDITKAPHPGDLTWDNLVHTDNDLIWNNIFVWTLFAVILLFWSIPVVAVQALANVEDISYLFDVDINEYLSVSEIAVLQGWVAVLIMDLWMQCLPMICGDLSKLHRLPNSSQTSLRASQKYYDCLLAMVLLVTVISSAILSNADTFWDYAKNAIASFTQITTLLGKGLANVSTFMLIYVCMTTFIWLPIELFRPAYFAKYYLGVKKPYKFKYSIWIPKTMLVFSIVLTYGVISPIVWILGLAFFCNAFFTFTYVLSTGYIEEIDCAQHWPAIFGRFEIGFFVSLLTQTSLLYLKHNYLKAVLLLPLLVFALIAMSKIEGRFKPIFKGASLTSAHDKDLVVSKMHEELKHDPNSYMPSVLKRHMDSKYGKDVFAKIHGELSKVGTAFTLSASADILCCCCLGL